MKILVASPYLWMSKEISALGHEVHTMSIYSDFPEHHRHYDAIWITGEHAAKYPKLNLMSFKYKLQTQVDPNYRKFFTKYWSWGAINYSTYADNEFPFWIKHPIKKLDFFPATKINSYSDIVTLRNDNNRIDPYQKLSDQTEIQITDHFDSIGQEYRFYILNGKVITGSTYGNEINKTANMHEIHTAQKIIDESPVMKSFMPNSIVMDTFIDSSNNAKNMYLLEFNNVWSSNWYESDLEKVIQCLYYARFSEGYSWNDALNDTL